MKIALLKRVLVWMCQRPAGGSPHDPQYLAKRSGDRIIASTSAGKPMFGNFAPSTPLSGRERRAHVSATLNFTSLILLALTAATASVRASEALVDCDGCRDLDVIGRYPQSHIMGFDQRAFDIVSYPVGPVVTHEGDVEPLKQIDAKGKRTQLFYWEPEGRSGLEVFENYRMAFKKAGLDPIWTCSGARECGERFGELALTEMHVDLNNTTEAREGSSDAEEPRYLVSKVSRPEGDTFAAVLVADLTLHTPPRAAAYVVETESAPMRLGMEIVTSDTLEKQLSEVGSALIYGIYFDFDKAEIKSASAPQIDAIAKTLKDDPALRITILGHTDNQGGEGYNLSLSSRRADAVKAELINHYGISDERIGTRGMGSLKPVADNATEEGRAKNRRVELLRQ